ncbi:hypothetical protein ABZ612_09510 [Streptomyces avermitilis]|uniref:hypothetical protein n=1 Tax=Streptomyces avermitilis TaxID=33903 RepID=UPI0034056573
MAAQGSKGASTPAARPVRPKTTAVPSASKGSSGTPSRASAGTSARAGADSVAAVTKRAPAVTKRAPAVTKRAPGVTNAAPGVTKTAPGVTKTAPGVTKTAPGVTKTAPGVTNAAPAVTGTVQHVVRPVAVGLAGSVVRPAGGLVDTVADGLADVSSQVPVSSFPSPSSLPPLPSLPTLPESLPTLPEPPSLPGLPGLPGLPTSPVQTLPAPASPQQPDGAAAHAGSAEQRETRESPAAYGPPVVGASWAGGSEMSRAPHGVGPAQAPAQQAPGDPAGELGRQSAVDNGAPRHGDAQAVPLDHRAPLRLVPGATAVVTADGTRDRYRDIPEFPG